MALTVGCPALRHIPVPEAGCSASCAGSGGLPPAASPASCCVTFRGRSHGMALAGGRRAAGAFRRWSSRRSVVGLARAAWKQEVLWAEAPVADVALAAEQLYHFVLDVSGNRQLIDGYTRPGQFVQVRVGDSKPAFLAISSPPQLAAKGAFEFLVKDVEGSTAALLCGLGKGDKVELSQVMGSGFNISQVSPAEEYPTVLLFATGSGISPIRALLESGIEAHRRKDVRLFYGARNLERMAFQDRFREWEASGVLIVPVLSQPADGTWAGEQGYVQAAFSKNKGILNPAQAGAVLCGQKGMAEEVTSLLLEEGVAKERILLNF